MKWKKRADEPLFIDLPPGVETVAFCHPDWRGIRAAAVASELPLIERRDLGAGSAQLVEILQATGVERILVHGYPPGTEILLSEAKRRGLWTACILHSSPAQHTGDGVEGSVAQRALELSGAGVIDKVGFVKKGVAEAFAALGYRAEHLPNRSPRATTSNRMDLGEGLHVGVFAEPIFRKNVATQILAASMLTGAVIHVMRAPDLAYLRACRIVEHGETGWSDFQGLLASMDLNLYVTLSECHPMTPLESYLGGVPCLVSDTSELFEGDAVLHDLTVVAQHDNPTTVARAAMRLLEERSLAVASARNWIRQADTRSAEALNAFLG